MPATCFVGVWAARVSFNVRCGAVLLGEVSVTIVFCGSCADHDMVTRGDFVPAVF